MEGKFHIKYKCDLHHRVTHYNGAEEISVLF